MGFRRSTTWPALLTAGLLCAVTPLLPSPASAQGGERLWGRVDMTSGQTVEGFIRWDRNEGAGEDLLDGTKATKTFLFQDWWRLAHPGSQRRDRVVELAGYRITWDDEEPSFPESVESGIRLGHLQRLEVAGEDSAVVTLRSGLQVGLTRGSTDLGSDLRDIEVEVPGEGTTQLAWEDLVGVEFLPAPPGVRPEGERLHGTVSLTNGEGFEGFLAWDRAKILTSDRLEGEDGEGRDRGIGFDEIARVRPTARGAVVTLVGGESMELFGTDDVDDGNDGILISDPGLGMVDVDWDDVEFVRFHRPDSLGHDGFLQGGRRLVGTVTTTDSTEVRGWIRWDGDEEFAWELLDGARDGTAFDVEFGLIRSIEKYVAESTAVTIGSRGVSVDHPVEEGSRVTLRDGRELILDGSNDVTENNHGIFVLPRSEGLSPEDEEAEWIMVRWEDFLSVHFETDPSTGMGGQG